VDKTSPDKAPPPISRASLFRAAWIGLLLALGVVILASLGLGTTDESVVAFRRANEEHRLLRERALVRERAGNLEGALDDYTAAIGYDANDYEATANRGLVRLKLGDPTKALEDAERAIALARQKGLPLYVRGCVREQKGEIPGAAGDFKLAVELDRKRYVTDRDPRFAEAVARIMSRATTTPLVLSPITPITSFTLPR